MNILVSAFACCPNKGSEFGVGWNWIVSLSSYCCIHAIVEKSQKSAIEEALCNLAHNENLFFYYVELESCAWKMYYNQGDWRFYYYYHKWQKKVFVKALEICRNNTIDIAHQLDLICFREPGYFSQLGIPYVWGPIGGVAFYPDGYKSSLRFSERIKFSIKKFISLIQLKYSHRVKLSAQQSRIILGTSNGIIQYFSKIYKTPIVHEPEVGCNYTDFVHVFPKDKFSILWVGRFIPSKQLDLALHIVSQLKYFPDIEFHIVGDGHNKAEYLKLAQKMRISDKCHWHGNIPIQDVHQLMKSSSLLLFTSLVEATATVVTEALTYRLPIICFDTCGFGQLLSNDCAVKIPLSNFDSSVHDFSTVIGDLYYNREKLVYMAAKIDPILQSQDWKVKARRIFEYYKQILNSKQ